MNPVYTLLFILPFGTGLFVYLYGAFVHSRRRGKAWPRSRTFFGILGVVLAVVSVTGPLAHLAHADFRFHMGTHLILGMLSPLLIHLSRPLTLILCTLSIQRPEACPFLKNPVCPDHPPSGHCFPPQCRRDVGVIHHPPLGNDASTCVFASFDPPSHFFGRLCIHRLPLAVGAFP
jgi:hypothetical protein